MNIDTRASFILDVLNKNGYEAYIVGGCVRDTLLNRDVHDWDICTNARPDTVYKIFGDLGLTVIDTGMKYGTVSVLLSLKDIDDINKTHNATEYDTELEVYEVTTFRKGSGTRKPENVEWADSIEVDLHRRDFTINALAYNSRTGIIDVTSGIDDIKNRIIRCVDDPYTRLKEDGLRIFRGSRFQSQLGFDIEENTYNAMKDLMYTITDTSVERVYSEFLKLMAGDYVTYALRNNKDIIKAIIPELGTCMGFEQNNKHHSYDVYEHSVKVVETLVNKGITDLYLRIAAILHDIGKPSTCILGEDGYNHFNNHAEVGALMAQTILRRLNAPKSTIDTIYELVKYHDFCAQQKSTMRKLVAKIGYTNVDRVIKLRYADVIAQSSYQLEEKLNQINQMGMWLDEIANEETALSIQDLDISGLDLIRVGYTPGKQFGVILKDLLDLVLSDNLHNNKSELIKYVLENYKVE